MVGCRRSSKTSAFALSLGIRKRDGVVPFECEGRLAPALSEPNNCREKCRSAQHVKDSFHAPNVREATLAFNVESAASSCMAVFGQRKRRKPARYGRNNPQITARLENSFSTVNLILPKQEDRSWLTIRPSRRRAAVSGSSFLPGGLSLYCYMPFLQGAGPQPSTPQCCQNRRQAERKQLLRRQASKNTTHTSSMSGGYLCVSTAFSVFKGGFSRNVFTSSQTENPEGFPC